MWLLFIILFLQFIKQCLAWLNDWETYVGTLSDEHNKQFLSLSTAGGLRVTLMSTLQLSDYLFTSSDDFSFEQTSRLGQDPLEV